VRPAGLPVIVSANTGPHGVVGGGLGREATAGQGGGRQGKTISVDRLLANRPCFAHAGGWVVARAGRYEGCGVSLAMCLGTLGLVSLSRSPLAVLLLLLHGSGRSHVPSSDDKWAGIKFNFFTTAGYGSLRYERACNCRGACPVVPICLPRCHTSQAQSPSPCVCLLFLLLNLPLYLCARHRGPMHFCATQCVLVLCTVPVPRLPHATGAL